MVVRFWGVRGSVGVPDRRMLRHGGNTACVEVTLSDGTEIILDAGSGIRALGAARTALGAPAHILLTHLHLDHIQGLLFFAPLFDPANEITVYGPPAPGPDLDQRLARYLSAPLSPVELRELPAKVTFASCPHEEFSIGSARIRSALVAHRGVTLGYRITEGDRTLCYLPDHEPALGSDLPTAEAGWISGSGLATGASVLIHDGQYTRGEYPGHVGWGHSAVPDAVTFARRVGAERLVLFHHDPEHDDDTLDALAGEAVRQWRDEGGEDGAVGMAAEGASLEV
jgi:phosphoribosyl 1,2-cyclic phosphodiesterase